jgi:hypothetical protein
VFKRTKRNEIGRYDQLPHVRLDESRIPAPLCPLLPFARPWGILGDDALERAVRVASCDGIVRAVEAARPFKDAIHDFAYRSIGPSATPVPDEVVLFQMFAWSLNRLEVESRAV